MASVGTDNNVPVEEILGYRVCTDPASRCVERILSWIDAQEPGRYFACANPHSLEVARTDPSFRAALLGSDLLVPDGVGMVYGSRLLGGEIRARVTGSDIFEGVQRELDRRGGYSVFFLGSTEEVLAKIARRMEREYPNLRWAGSYSPPFAGDFTPEQNEAMVAAVNRVRPDLLWVGMTAPKQEKWIARHRDRLEVKFIGPIGAVFDFYAGTVRRSHPLFQRLGLEWLPRLLQQPRRLWRRNFVSSPCFVLRVLAQRWRR